MNKTLPVVLGLLLVVSVVGNVFLYSEVQKKDAEISGLQADLATWKDNYSKLDEHATSLEEQLNEANSKLTEYEKQISDLQGQINELKDQINELNAQLDDKNAQISILQGQLDNAQTNLDNLENLYENMKFGLFYARGARGLSEGGDWAYHIAGLHYDARSNSDAREYYLEAASYYKGAKQSYLKAEDYFKKALEYVEGDEEELINNYLKVVQYGVKLTDAMYYAASYMADACYYYDIGDYENGDYYVDKANEQIKMYNSYLDTYNLYAEKIDEYFGVS